jgi:hypothetical protein
VTVSFDDIMKVLIYCFHHFIVLHGHFILDNQLCILEKVSLLRRSSKLDLKVAL